MKLTITINMDGAAFEDDPQTETERILRELIYSRAFNNSDGGDLRDANGNTCGQWEVQP